MSWKKEVWDYSSQSENRVKAAIIEKDLTRSLVVCNHSLDRWILIGSDDEISNAEADIIVSAFNKSDS